MVRLKDIAAQSGHSISTVSKALNYSEELSTQTIEQIWQTARAMGYMPKRSQDSRGKFIGVILPEVEGHHYSHLLHALNRKLESQGYTMFTMLTSYYSQSVRPLLERMYQLQPDGLILQWEPFFTREDYEMLCAGSIPAILLNGSDMNFPLDSIEIHPENGVRLAVEHLTQLGHRKIGYLGEHNSDIRYRAFCRQLEQHRITPNPAWILQTDTRFEKGGYELATALLDRGDLPTAIVACYDVFAMGIIKAFSERGIRIPEDISLISFDNIVMDDYCSVPLSSVAFPVEEMSAIAVKVLMDAIRNPAGHVVQNISLWSKLVARNSTAPCRED